MKTNFSTKTLLLIQILLVLFLIPMDIFLGKVTLDYVLPLYILVWILTYSKISKSED
jgi:polyferredoxin